VCLLLWCVPATVMYVCHCGVCLRPWCIHIHRYSIYILRTARKHRLNTDLTYFSVMTQKLPTGGGGKLLPTTIVRVVISIDIATLGKDQAKPTSILRRLCLSRDLSSCLTCSYGTIASKSNETRSLSLRPIGNGQSLYSGRRFVTQV
jgi:hypothetical protein